MSLRSYVEAFLRKALTQEKQRGSNSYNLLSEDELPEDIRKLIGAGLPSDISEEDKMEEKSANVPALSCLGKAELFVSALTFYL